MSRYLLHLLLWMMGRNLVRYPIEKCNDHGLNSVEKVSNTHTSPPESLLSHIQQQLKRLASNSIVVLQPESLSSRLHVNLF